jgi:lysyl-tRNA synthetase, class II
MLGKVQEDRLNKLNKMRELGIDPYGARYDSAVAIDAVLADHTEDAEGKSTEGQTADIAGRIVLMRDMGKMMFAHLRDETGQMQVAFRKNALEEGSETAWPLAKLLDLGDIVATSGKLQKSRTGEITIWADSLTMLTKSLNPMPEKFHGLVDVETRYRQRYLDLMTNADSMRVFKQRVQIIDRFRDILRAKGFNEVETPMLQSIYGGAAARPFETHHNALDCDLFMRISPELYLKRLMVGGMEKVFEINRNFRNEGIDTSHNPEFTMMELYQAYADYNVMMDITEELVSDSAEQVAKPAVVERIAELQAILEKKEDAEADSEETLAQKAELAQLEGCVEQWAAGKLLLPYGKTVVDYTRPWTRSKYADLLKEHAGVEMTDIDAVKTAAAKHHIGIAGKADEVIINDLFEEVVEPALEEVGAPVFVMDYPAALCPLTRRDPDDDSIALRFELFAAGMELANAYTELNDPAIQEANFAQQLDGEDDETMRVMDEDFVTALRHGMPPAGGLGVGIDRIVMLLTNRPSIRDVILFPLLRPGAS